MLRDLFMDIELLVSLYIRLGRLFKLNKYHISVHGY